MKYLFLRGGERIFVRNLSPRDSPRELADYINPIIREKAFITLEKPVSLAEERKWFLKNLSEVRRGLQICLIAEKDGRVVSVAQAVGGRNKEKGVTEIGISVSKEFRGLGLGRFMLEEVMKLARKKLKPRIIYLVHFGSNSPARKLYEKMGFREVACLPKWFNHFGRLEDCVFMVLK